MTICDEKYSFISKKDAKKGARLIRKLGAQEVLYKKGQYIKEGRLIPYLCPHCDCWHLTSSK